MIKPVLRWTLILASLFALGPAAGFMVDQLQDVDGGRAVTLLVNGSTSAGLLAGLVVLVAAAFAGVVGTYFFSLGTGMTCAGLIFAWGAWGLGTVNDIVQRAASGADFSRLALDGAAVSLAGLAMCAVFLVIAEGRQHPSPTSPNASPTRKGLRGPLPLLLVPDVGVNPVPALAASLLGSMVVGGVLVWLVAVSSARGQTLMAALVGGLGAAAAAHLIGSSMKAVVTPLVPFLALVFLAVIGPVAGKLLHGDHLVEATYAEHLFALARPLSLDWPAGAMLGIPVGLGWAGAMLDKRAAEPN